MARTRTRRTTAWVSLAVIAAVGCDSNSGDGDQDASSGPGGSAGLTGGGAGSSGSSGSGAAMGGASGGGGEAGCVPSSGASGTIDVTCSKNCVSQLALGAQHSCALKSSGTVWCWGAAQSSPVEVTALGNSVQRIAAGLMHTCALKADGTVWCWGDNSSAQLGTGTTDDSAMPVQAALASEVTMISAGGSTTCAGVPTGSFYCWGANGSGQAGDGTTATPKLLPTQMTIVPPYVGGQEVIVHGDVSCTLVGANELQCWGNNTDGAVGSGSPDALILDRVFVALDVSRSSGRCAVQYSGLLSCWGPNSSGQVGDGTTVAKSTATKVKLPSNAKDVGKTFRRTCALMYDGTVWCWGRNVVGELGDGTLGGSPCPDGPCKPDPVRVAGLTGVELMATGESHACASQKDGTTWCWGQNQYGQLGNGTSAGQSCGSVPCEPAPVKALLTCP